jgi:hypothetical protein
VGTAACVLDYNAKAPCDVSLAEAKTMAEESLAMSIEMEKTDTLIHSRIVLARIDALENNPDRAIQGLRDLLSTTLNDETQTNVHYWIWKLSGLEADKTIVANMYEQLLTKIPKFEFRKRLAELRGEPIAMNADDLISP